MLSGVFLIQSSNSGRSRSPPPLRRRGGFLILVREKLKRSSKKPADAVPDPP